MNDDLLIVPASYKWRQFVFDNDGNPVHGNWIYIPEPDVQSRK
jgi:hypothetical protein